MSKIIVDHYNSETGICQLRDEAGRRFSARCEPTGKNRNQNQNERGEQNMQTETFENAGQELDSKVKVYAAEHHCDYAKGLRAMKELEPNLYRSYASGQSDLSREIERGAREFARRIPVHSEEFGLDEASAEKMVKETDPKMRIYSKEQGGVTVNTEKIPLDPGSVVDARASELLATGKAKNYGEAMKAALEDDPLLSECYRSGKPYLEASRQYVEDPMRATEIRAITEPRPDATVTPSPDRPAPQFTNTARLRLGALLAGAKSADGSIDIPLALQIAGLVPDEVRSACGEALDEIARAMIARRGMRGQVSEAYPEGYRLAVAEHPALWTASQTGKLTEESLKDLFIQWFK